MVYCSAVGCNSDSRYVGSKQGVSYHRFPTDDKLLKEVASEIIPARSCCYKRFQGMFASL